MTVIYHVAPEDHEGDLLSLYDQEGDEAYETYLKRWPESGNLGLYHAHYIHCYVTLEEAHEHAGYFGGKIYEIECEELDVAHDNLEFDHPVVRERIERKYIREVGNPEPKAPTRRDDNLDCGM